MDYIRTKYAIKTSTLNEDFTLILAEKSAFEKIEIRKIVSIINKISCSTSIKKETLLELNNVIENFYIKTGAYGK